MEKGKVNFIHVQNHFDEIHFDLIRRFDNWSDKTTQEETILYLVLRQNKNNQDLEDKDENLLFQKILLLRRRRPSFNLM